MAFLKLPEVESQMQISPYLNSLSSRDLVNIFCERKYGFALDSTQLVDSLGGGVFLDRSHLKL